jgi:hypothetical protein
MMRLSLIKTWSGNHRHRTLLVQFGQRMTATLWLHHFERPWQYKDEGVLCGGLGFLSFNIFSPKAFLP